MLDHNSIRTTQIYAKIVQKKLSNDMKVVKIGSKLIRLFQEEAVIQFGLLPQKGDL